MVFARRPFFGRSPIQDAIAQRGTIPFIEVARSIAPLLVLWVHLGANFGYATPVYAFITNELHLIQGAAHVGVLIFFLVSGFIISHVSMTETRSEFAVKRLFRIMPMLFVGVALAYATSVTLQALGLPPIGNAVSPFHALLSALLLDWVLSTPFTLSITWTLLTEMSFYAYA